MDAFSAFFLGLAGKKKRGVLPFERDGVHVMALAQGFAQQCHVVSDAATERIGRADDGDLHFHTFQGARASFQRSFNAVCSCTVSIPIQKP